MVRFLSNLFSRRSGSTAPLQLGTLSPSQLHPALELMLATPNQSADTAQLISFTQSAKARGLDTMQTRIAFCGDQLLYAICPAILPGRTLMLISGTPAGARQEQAAAALLASIVADYSQRDLVLMQTLVDPHDSSQIAVYSSCGFSPLAELIYLEAPARKAAWKLPDESWQLLTYAPELEGEFAQAIVASYEQTLDCPQLNGLRNTSDIIAGHKAAGEFDPHNWFLLRHAGEPVGVLLLARVPATDAMELVYIGLAKFARGKGVAAELMKLALNRAAERSCRRLTTAVDAQNKPAIAMYLRAGMQRIGTRLALLRVIHSAGSISSTIDQQSPK